MQQYSMHWALLEWLPRSLGLAGIEATTQRLANDVLPNFPTNA
jgi:hypothetical protein